VTVIAAFPVLIVPILPSRKSSIAFLTVSVAPLPVVNLMSLAVISAVIPAELLAN
jgi:hypothetical protein